MFQFVMSVCFGLLPPAANGTPVQPAPLAKPAADKLDGNWVVVQVEEKGKKVTGMDMEILTTWIGRLHIHDDKIDIVRGNQTRHLGSFVVGPGSGLRTIDLDIPTAFVANEQLHGIVELRGDELRACFAGKDGAGRPLMIDGSAVSGNIVYVLRRLNRSEAAAFDLGIRDSQRLTGTWKVKELTQGDRKATPAEMRNLNLSINELIAQMATFRHGKNVAGNASFKLEPLQYDRIDMVLTSSITLADGFVVQPGTYRGHYHLRNGIFRIALRLQLANGRDDMSSPLVVLSCQN